MVTHQHWLLLSDCLWLSALSCNGSLLMDSRDLDWTKLSVDWTWTQIPLFRLTDYFLGINVVTEAAVAALHSSLPLCLLFLCSETLCSGLSGSRLWNQRRCKCWTPRLREVDQRRPALAPPPDTDWIAAHVERALTPRPAALRAVGGATRESVGGKLARLGWAILMLERCSSRTLPAIR